MKIILLPFSLLRWRSSHPVGTGPGVCRSDVLRLERCPWATSATVQPPVVQATRETKELL